MSIIIFNLSTIVSKFFILIWFFLFNMKSNFSLSLLLFSLNFLLPFVFCQQRYSLWIYDWFRQSAVYPCQPFLENEVRSKVMADYCSQYQCKCVIIVDRDGEVYMTASMTTLFSNRNVTSELTEQASFCYMKWDSASSFGLISFFNLWTRSYCIN